MYLSFWVYIVTHNFKGNLVNLAVGPPVSLVPYVKLSEFSRGVGFEIVSRAQIWFFGLFKNKFGQIFAHF